jgi:hypothetical protein
MTIKEDYEQYCKKAMEHLKIATKNNIPYNMDWLMFFKFNLEEYYDKEKLDQFIEENQINDKYDFVDINYRAIPCKVFYGNKLNEIHDYHTRSNYLKNITFDLFGGRQNCFWPKPNIDEELFKDYLSGEISEKQFIKITMRAQQKCR